MGVIDTYLFYLTCKWLLILTSWQTISLVLSSRKHSVCLPFICEFTIGLLAFTVCDAIVMPIVIANTVTS